MPQYFYCNNLAVLSFPFLYMLRKNVLNFETKKFKKLLYLTYFFGILRDFEVKSSKFIIYAARERYQNLSEEKR